MHSSLTAIMDQDVPTLHDHIVAINHDWDAKHPLRVMINELDVNSSEDNIIGASDHGHSNNEEGTTENDVYPDFQIYTDGAPECNHPLRTEEIDYTLVTQLSYDRVWMMRKHCRRWPGNISVVIFTDKDLPMILTELQALGCANANDVNKFQCQTVVASEYDVGEYPVNKLRNLALSQIITTHVLLVDVDFWPSTELYDTLMMQNVKSWLSSDYSLAIVVPAFQVYRDCDENEECEKENIAKMPSTMKDVTSRWRHGHPWSQVYMFDPTNVGGHGSTDYPKFLEMQKGDLYDIECTRSNRYEPYVAVRYCEDLPPYQEQFTGYGKNKVSQAIQMRQSGYLYSQLGGGFVVHYPHLDSASRKKWNKGTQFDKEKNHKIPRSETRRAEVDKLFKQFKEWVNDELSDNMARSPLCADTTNDDYKLWI